MAVTKVQEAIDILSAIAGTSPVATSRDLIQSTKAVEKLAEALQDVLVQQPGSSGRTVDADDDDVQELALSLFAANKRLSQSVMGFFGSMRADAFIAGLEKASATVNADTAKALGRIPALTTALGSLDAESLRYAEAAAQIQKLQSRIAELEAQKHLAETTDREALLATLASLEQDIQGGSEDIQALRRQKAGLNDTLGSLRQEQSSLTSVLFALEREWSTEASLARRSLDSLQAILEKASRTMDEEISAATQALHAKISEYNRKRSMCDETIERTGALSETLATARGMTVLLEHVGGMKTEADTIIHRIEELEAAVRQAAKDAAQQKKPFAVLSMTGTSVPLES